jgi:hypothetical protein
MRITKRNEKVKDAVEQKLQIKVTFDIKNMLTGYSDNQTVVRIKTDQTLNSTTDTKMKELKAEIEDIISKAISDLDEKMSGSDAFTDGYWEEQRKSDALASPA